MKRRPDFAPFVEQQLEDELHAHRQDDAYARAWVNLEKELIGLLRTRVAADSLKALELLDRSMLPRP